MDNNSGYNIDDKFIVDHSNFLGHQYSQYKNALMSKATCQ